MAPRRFVLDQNFPDQALIVPWPETIRLVRLRDAAPQLVERTDDWQIFVALARQADVDGFITNDSAMLNLPREMVALSQTRLTLIIAASVGGQPVRASGLLMTHLIPLAQRLDDGPSVYVLRTGSPRVERPGQIINRIASHRNVSPSQLTHDEQRFLAAYRAGGEA